LTVIRAIKDILVKVSPLYLGEIGYENNNSIRGYKIPRWQNLADVTIPIPNLRQAKRLNDSDFRELADVADIPDGSSRSFEVSGHDILICHTRGEFFAVENQCSHAMAKLEGGRLRAFRLSCPLHGASFDVRDGSVLGKPATKPIRVYPLRVNDGRIQVCLEPQHPGSAD